MATTAVHLTIRGRVQGVGYRAWVADTATETLTGWVRNRRDGSVEAVAAGRPDMIELFVAECRDGPRAAIVSGIESESYDGPPINGFKVLPDA
mgnify:CR=1 FL=1